MEKSVCIRDKADPAQIRRGRELVSGSRVAFGELAAALALAGNEVRHRRSYISWRRKRSFCPCDLSDMLGMSIPAISQHLRKMKDGNMVESREGGADDLLFGEIGARWGKLLRRFFKIINQMDAKPEMV